MELKKIEILNFKSIKELKFDVKKIGNSYTTMLLGINEVGKSNILKAMSFLNTPENEYLFSEIHNQKDEDSEYVDIFFYFDMDVKKYILDPIKKDIDNNNILSFNLTNIKKNVFLNKEESLFDEEYVYEIEILSKNIFIKSDVDSKIEVSLENDEENTFKPLTEDTFYEILSPRIDSILKRHEPKVSFWKPSPKYLISTDINLNDFKDNTTSNIPLKNIFALCGYDNHQKINERIEEINIPQKRSRLAGKLSQETTKYIKKIWNHNIGFVFDISETGNCTISVRDGGKDNEYDRHSMNVRSEGFKQFISLILSLSIETKKFSTHNNRLIIIDEPENHLHPSGIRDLSKELLEIGRNNYLFISTHSPFMIDQDNKERHIIIKKDSLANTIKKEIKEEIDLRDDEVLSQAFGINIYKDLLNPNKILVEGASDKIILEKIFNHENIDFGITNGNGSNIVSIASRLNTDAIDIITLVDDDKEGKKYKEDILKIKGVFSEKNVFTLKDLVPSLIDNGTIEDILGKNYIYSELKKEYKRETNKEVLFELKEDSPLIEQIKIELRKDSEINNIDLFLDNLKVLISNNFKPSKTTWEQKFPLLKELINSIRSKIKSNQ